MNFQILISKTISAVHKTVTIVPFVLLNLLSPSILNVLQFLLQLIESDYRQCVRQIDIVKTIKDKLMDAQVIITESTQCEILFLQVLFHDLMSNRDFREMYRFHGGCLLESTLEFLKHFHILPARIEYTRRQLEKMLHQICRKSKSPFSAYNPDHVLCLRLDPKQAILKQFLFAPGNLHVERYREIVEIMVWAIGEFTAGDLGFVPLFKLRMQTYFVLFVCPRFHRVHYECIEKGDPREYEEQYLVEDPDDVIEIPYTLLPPSTSWKRHWLGNGVRIV